MKTRMYAAPAVKGLMLDHDYGPTFNNMGSWSCFAGQSICACMQSSVNLTILILKMVTHHILVYPYFVSTN